MAFKQLRTYVQKSGMSFRKVILGILAGMLAIASLFAVWYVPSVGRRASRSSPDKHTIAIPSSGAEWEGKSTAQLIALLDHDDLIIRERAVRELQRRKGVHVTDALIRVARGDPSEAVRLAALTALLMRHDARIYDVLLDALKRGSFEARLAAMGLMRSPFERVWERIVEIYFSDESPHATQYALRLLKRPPKVAMRAICRMLGTGIAIKDDGDAKLNAKQRELLSAIERVPKDALVELLDERDIAVVVGALQLLLKFPMDKAATKLVKLVNSRNQVVKALAATALASAPSHKVAKQLKRMVHSGDRIVAACATAALSAVGEGKLRDVEPLLNDPDPAVRCVAVRSLLQLKASHKRILEHLKRALNDADINVRLTAAQGLLAFGSTGLSLYLKHLERMQGDERVAMLMGLRGLKEPEVLQTLATDITNSDARVRWAAQTALASFGVDAISVLKKALTHTDPQVRAGVVQALMQIGGDAVTDILMHVVRDDPSEFVRITAISALGATCDERAVAVLKELLYDDNRNVAQEAGLALGRMGGAGVRVLKQVLKSSNATVRALVARVLASYGDPEAGELLRQLAHDATDDTTRIVALQALSRAGDVTAMRELIKLLSASDNMTRLKARAAILGLRHTMVMPLVRALQDENPRIRAEAAFLLGIMRVEMARERLMELLEDKDANVRRAVKRALQIMNASQVKAHTAP
ncbi:MAG TPA: HEAT repeat domain-containing protein, partial [Armatimonadetes bacterium]|nr:HEAT repeat domain-containing protein [Armatimonadota bacterium]